jgi:hypothetical protein
MALGEIEGIAEALTEELEMLNIQEVWDNSGSTRYGYVDPNDLACEMLEEVLEPFLNEWKELTESEDKEAYAKQLIKGLEQFKASDSGFKDWAVNGIDETLDELKQG